MKSPYSSWFEPSFASGILLMFCFFWLQSHTQLFGITSILQMNLHALILNRLKLWSGNYSSQFERSKALTVKSGESERLRSFIASSSSCLLCCR